MNLVEIIPEGKENRINRHQLINRIASERGISIRDAERTFHYELATIRQSAVVITTGSGYYRPRPDVPEEVLEAKHYIERENSRTIKIQKNLVYTHKWLADVDAGRL